MERKVIGLEEKGFERKVIGLERRRLQMRENIGLGGGGGSEGGFQE